ncbi:KH domain-containing protein At4g18375 isoform X3 [Elaeis guineensis]|uniref:KH domain-containing protein At4g18375 isoform X3 n=1 Tax=Elaeis guineensis var. tenera TaxID=51953 RepID=UPI003C6D2752
MAGQRNNYGKRSHSQLDLADNEGSKRRNPGEKDPYIPGPEDTVYRYLCPGKKIGSIIGRGGEIVKQLRSDTKAKIRIGESIPGCEERVITIFSTSMETNAFEDTSDNVCPAQDALFRVHERLVTDEALGDEDTDAGNPQVTIRLLVPSDQIGCIIGKGGQIIQGIRSDTGAQIRILKNEHLPACAISSDELLQITGDASVVKKALVQVSSRLHDNPSRSQHLLASNMSQTFPSGGQFGVSSAGAPVMGLGPLMGPYGGYKGETVGDWPAFYPPRDENSAKEFSLRLICPSANIGGVIGKGGVIIKQIRQESGAFIKVNSSAEEDDCIITISAKEFFEDPISPTIDAAIRLQPRCSEKTERESGEHSYTTRLLVPTSRIGCLIGKGGTIISEMRRSTRANIRILSKENLPKVASEDDEMVQISGDLDVARNALVQVTTRLKANFFERESALSSFPPSVPYHPSPNDSSEGSKYGARDSKAHGHGYSYSGGYGISGDLPPSESYGSYGGSQGVGSSYGTYGGYLARSGSAGFAGAGKNVLESCNLGTEEAWLFVQRLEALGFKADAVTFGIFICLKMKFSKSSSVGHVFGDCRRYCTEFCIHPPSFH